MIAWLARIKDEKIRKIMGMYQSITIICFSLSTPQGTNKPTEYLKRFMRLEYKMGKEKAEHYKIQFYIILLDIKR